MTTNAQDSSIPPSTRLRRAIHLRSDALVRRIIQSNAGNRTLLLNADPDDRYNTSLHLVAQLGLPDIADFLLSLGHEDEGISRNTDGITPLMLAVQAGGDDADPVVAGRIAVGRMLMQRFPETVPIKDKQGMNALHHLASHGTTALIPLLLSIPVQTQPYTSIAQPAPPTLTRTTSTTSPTSTTTATSTANIHPLIPHPDNAGNTPLHHASASGHLKAVRLLVHAGADPAARNAQMWTPLDYSFSVAAEVYLRNLMRERAASRQGGAANTGAVGSPVKPSTGGGLRKGAATAMVVEAAGEASDEDDEGNEEGMVVGGRISRARTAN